jgi:hypothetical protein
LEPTVSTSAWASRIGSAKVARDSRCHVGMSDRLLTSWPDDKSEGVVLVSVVFGITLVFLKDANLFHIQRKAWHKNPTRLQLVSQLVSHPTKARYPCRQVMHGTTCMIYTFILGFYSVPRWTFPWYFVVCVVS